MPREVRRVKRLRCKYQQRTKQAHLPDRGRQRDQRRAGRRRRPTACARHNSQALPSSVTCISQ